MTLHHDIRIARNQIDGVLNDLQHFLGDDEALKLDMLEGETTLHDVVRRLFEAIENDEGQVASLDKQIDDRGLRAERAKQRIEATKAAIGRLMDCAQIKSLPLPEATFSLVTRKGTAKVVDPDQLPDQYVIVSEVRKPDTKAIKQAAESGETIPGVMMTNGGSSLSVRRK